MYHYTECGLSDVYLANGYKEKQTPYGPAVAIEDIDTLHDVISDDVIQSPSRLTGEQIRFLRREMDLTQANLAKPLKVDAQTVARWERVQCEVPGPADGLIRVLYAWHRNKPEVRKLFERLADLEDIQAKEKTFHRVKADGHWALAA